MDRIMKGAPPTKSHLYPAHADAKQLSGENERKQLFEYKEKFDPSYLNFGVQRPLMGGAGWSDKMLLESKINVDSLNVPTLHKKPFCNLLHVPGVKERGFLTRFIYYSYVTTSRKTNHKYPHLSEVRRKVLSDEKLHQAIQTTISTTESFPLHQDNVLSDRLLEKRLRNRAVMHLDEMLATITSRALKFCGWLFLAILRQLTSAVHVHQGQLDFIRAISHEKTPVLYCPLHFSHFDYILLSLIMYHNEIRAPFVASGNNLLIQPFSFIMRRVGGFFIRRKLDDGINKDLVYRAVLHSYVMQLLKHNQSLEIFIEGTRTRSGLPNQPKTGLLSVAVEALEHGEIPDINIVPVCISYEKVLEGTFRKELTGRSKKPETFFSSVVHITKLLCGFYGHIRVNFGVPQSLKKTLYELQISPSCTFSSNVAFTRSSSLYEQVTMSGQNVVDTNKAKTKSSSSPQVDADHTPNDIVVNARQHQHKMATPSSVPLLASSNPNEDEKRRELVTFLGERIVYSSLRCRAFMSTNLVAFLLLHRWRNGATMPDLVESFRQLTTELITRKRDIGFSGDYHEVVLHAIHLLGGDLVQLDCAYSNRIQRSPSHASIHSTDSGYDVGSAGPTPTRPVPDVVVSADAPLAEKDPHHGSDSGEDMSVHGEQEFLTTGQYMLKQTASEYSECISELPGPLSLNDSSMQNSATSFTTTGTETRDLCLFIQPVLDTPQVFDVAYYANALTPVFAIESIVALTVGAVLNFRFSTLAKRLQLISSTSKLAVVTLDVDDVPDAVRRSFLRSRLLEKALELIDILQMDLILCDVTKNLETALSEAIDSLIAAGFFTSQDCGTSSATKKSQTAFELGFDDDDSLQDQWLKINLEQTPAFFSTQSIMSAFVEGYVAASSKLSMLLEAPLTEEQIKHHMLTSAQQRVAEGLSVRSESSSSDVIRNALRSFEWNGIIERSPSNQKLLCLTEDFSDTDSITNLISRISQFLY